MLRFEQGEPVASSVGAEAPAQLEKALGLSPRDGGRESSRKGVLARLLRVRA